MSTQRVGGRVGVWVRASALVAFIVAVLGGLAVFGSSTLPERVGPAVEELAVERTVLTRGAIELELRNTGPDPVQVAQVAVNDAFVDFTGVTEPIERLGSGTLVLDYPWQSGQPYRISLLTSTGLVIESEIAAAVATPPAGSSVFAVMVLLGTYVGIVPVVLGMLFLPVLRQAGERMVRALLALTVGLLALLAVDATLEGFEIAAGSTTAFGGPLLVILGAALAFLALTAVARHLSGRAPADDAGARPGPLLALMVAIGIGLHNLGEGLAIGSAYAIGELALGAALVVGFAVHNTTEGLAIVAPLTAERPPVRRLLGLGVLAGAPAILGALIGVTVDNRALTAFLLGLGVGAIAQVVVQIAPALRDRAGRLLDPVVVGGVGCGLLLIYFTGLLIA